MKQHTLRLIINKIQKRDEWKGTVISNEFVELPNNA